MRQKRFLSVILTAVLIVGLLAPTLPSLPVSAAAAIEGWNTGTGGSDSGAEIDGDVHYSGSGSLRIHQNTVKTNNVYFSLTTSISVEQGKTYKYGFMAKGNSVSGATVMIDWGTRHSLIPFASTFDWTPFEFTYKHTAKANSVTLRFIVEDITKALWLDQMYFYEVSDGALVGENLISNPGFDSVFAPVAAVTNDDTLDSLTKYLLSSTSIPVYRAESITVDGDFSDWSKDYNVIPIRGVSMLKSCTPDLIANMRLAWDEKNLYIAIDATDDSHEPMEGSGFWQGDSVQLVMSVDDENRTFGTEIGFAYHAANDVSEICQVTNPDLQFKATRNGNVLNYEIAVPWTVYFGGRKPDTLLFNVLINDTDNGSRNYGMELAPEGISVKKSALNDPVLILRDNPGETKFISSIYGSANSSVGKEEEFRVSIFNNTASEQTYEITCQETGETKSLSIPPQGSGEERLQYAVKDSGNVVLNFEVANGGETQEMLAKLSVAYSAELPNEAECKIMLDTLDSYVEDIKPLMTKCAEMGYELDYEMVDYYVLQRFTQMQKDKIAAGKYDYILYQYTKLTEIYNELKPKLESYIKGEAEPLLVPRMVTSDDRDVIDGQSFITTVEYDGKVEKRPYFYVGTGHWDYVKSDIVNMKKMGYDTIHIEIGPNQVIYPESFATGWDVSINGKVPDYSVTLQEETVKSGKYAAKIVNNTPYNFNNFFRVTQSFEVEPDTVYEYGGYIKGTGISSGTAFSVSGTAYEDQIKVGGTYDWKEYKGTFKTKSTDTRKSIFLTSDAPSTAIYLDDLWVRKQGTEENILNNPGFEMGTNDPDSIGNGMKAKYTVIENLERIMQEAEENDIAIELLISPHYFSSFVAAEDQTVNDGGKIVTQYMPFNPTHPKVQEVLEKYISILIPRVKDYKSLHSIVMANEPAFCANLGTYYLPIYHEYLKEKYDDDIAKLNVAYGGAEYKSFEDIPWPSAFNASQYWNDYRVFNDSLLTEFHTYLYKAIKKEAPDIPIQTKQMSNFHRNYPSYPKIINGTDYETWLDVLDINGNDAGASMFNGEGGSIYALEGWFDWQTSVMDAPCANTEDHILSARNEMDYGEIVPIHCAAQVWQGAVHGRGITNLWIWDVTESLGENNSLLTNRPMVVSKTAKAGFDLNRAAYDVTAVQKTERRVAILKSDWSFQNSMNYTNAYYNASMAVLNNGLRPFYLTDYNYAKIHNYDLVILPDCSSITDDQFEEIKKYVDNGGKLLVIGKDCMSVDENGKERDAKAIQAVVDKADFVDISYMQKKVTNVDEVAQKVQEVIEKANLDIVSVFDKETGKKVAGTEWLSGAYDGNMVVNICNMETGKAKMVYIEVNGKRVDSFYEVRGEKTYSDGEITLNPYEPVIVRFKTDNPFFDTYGHWAQTSIENLYANELIKGKSNTRFAPEETLTGGEIATLIARAAGLEFSEDIEDANWYDGAVAALKNAGIAGDALDVPDDNVSRESIAYLIVRCYEYMTGKTAKEAEVGYADRNSISSDKISSVKKAAGLGFMTGDNTNTFRGGDFVSRAEISAIIERLYDAAKK